MNRYVCMPRLKNIAFIRWGAEDKLPSPAQKGWKLVSCPECNEPCYELPEQKKHGKAVCSKCFVEKLKEVKQP